MKKKIYLAGPMAGLPDFGRSAFWHINSFFMDKTWNPLPEVAVLNPAHLPLGLEVGEYMEVCLPMVKVANCLIMLPGWEDSKGANAELALAKVHRHTVFEVQFSVYDGTDSGHFENYPITDNVVIDHPTNGTKERMMLTVLHAGSEGKPTLKDFTNLENNHA